ncbi:uncharacterized protein BHQ10_007550 [Talaromyces amestolkiae]|uniref:Lytic polysaccharide monooxygenase n=1 Tax=Talaromyces amestolkiae TaxID=1196081 RepID=A0A364L6U4_TALAM|nr:uncharacterized protein BHQ10_007550 [Talaromyces amestolkiae]RAO71538.1 hypothetical protein BHQ10_007550 [Talaromyces amestolkiae]
MFSTKKHLLLSAFLASWTVQGHMIMTSPQPFGQDTLNNSPLAGDGSDFPCKLRSDTYSYTADVLSANTYHVGDSPLLSFKGGATHGGGSCQISLTTDLTPTKDSTWFVIHSIEGGCPTNAAGNIGDDANAPDPTTFNFTVPDIAAGRYTLAWTWFNRIGNREMYMNCAPVEILSTAGSGKREVETSLSKRADFPEMFVANINGCTTKEDFDIRFPNPGDSVVYLGEATNLLPSGQAACTGGAGITATGVIAAPTPTGTGAASGTSGSASGGSSGASTGSSTTAAATILTTTAATSTVPENTVQPVPAPTSTEPATSVATSTPSTGSSSDTTSSALSGACSTEGIWNCIDGTSFQRCASGAWSAAQPVAAGTKCNAGQSSDLTLVAAKRAYAGHIHDRRRSLVDKAQS